MGNKRVLQELKKRAASLPVIMTTTAEDHYVTGAELIEQGQYEWNGKVVEPQKLYLQKMPVKIAYNHYRRMKKAYDQHGLAGIKAYENSIADIVEKRKAQV